MSDASPEAPQAQAQEQKGVRDTAAYEDAAKQAGFTLKERAAGLVIVSALGEDAPPPTPEQFVRCLFDTDMKLYGAAVLPQEVCCNKSCPDPPKELQGSYLVQVAGVKNVTKAPNSILDVETETKKRPNRTLAIEFTDGVNTCKGIELKQLDALSKLQPGMKVRLVGPIAFVANFLLLEERNVQVLGGNVQQLVRQWKAAQNRLVAGGGTSAPAFQALTKETLEQMMSKKQQDRPQAEQPKQARGEPKKEAPKEALKKEVPKKETPKKEVPKKEAPKEALKKEVPKKEAPKEAPKKEVSKKEAPKKEAPKKEVPKKEAPKEAPKKEVPKKEAPKEAPKKEVPKKEAAKETPRKETPKEKPKEALKKEAQKAPETTQPTAQEQEVTKKRRLKIERKVPLEENKEKSKAVPEPQPKPQPRQEQTQARGPKRQPRVVSVEVDLTPKPQPQQPQEAPAKPRKLSIQRPAQQQH